MPGLFSGLLYSSVTLFADFRSVGVPVSCCCSVGVFVFIYFTFLCWLDIGYEYGDNMLPCTL